MHTPTSPVHGESAPQFSDLRRLLARNLLTGRETGASLYVSIDGIPVVDLWGGWQDADHIRPWTTETVSPVFSATKTVSSVAMLMLVDRGILDLDRPVADYWPEFAAKGKDSILVRHVLSHSAGLSGWDRPFTAMDAFDLVGSTARLAAQRPWWSPGSASCYHASTWGHLVAEIFHRASGHRMGDFIDEEISRRLDADFSLGVGDARREKTATIYPLVAGPAPKMSATELNPLEQEVHEKTLVGSFGATLPETAMDFFNSERWRNSRFAGSSGYSNARGLGRIVDSVTNNGESGGRRLLSETAVNSIFEEQVAGTDMYFRAPMRWGNGYALSSSQGNAGGPLPFLRCTDQTAYWYGAGGSYVLADREQRITVAYVMNQCRPSDDTLGGLYYDQIYERLGRRSQAYPAVSRSGRVLSAGGGD